MEHTYFRNFSKQIYNRIDFLISSGALADKKIILFGLNSSSYVVRDYLRKKNIQISAYIDNNEKKRSQSKEITPAYAPYEMSEKFGNNVAILITSKYYSEMKAQLEELGYIENKHIFQVIDVHDLEQYVDFSNNQGMREITKEELKKIQLELLDETKRVCEKHGLRYYLCGGTLIGAVRHKGYIPWDDDIDVVMPMKDYHEFINIMNKESKYPVLSLYDNSDVFHSFYARVVCPETNMKTWDYPYIESLGINIDIFPLYGVPEGEIEADEFAEKMENLHVEFIEEFIKYPEPTKRYFDLQNQILEMMEEYDFDSSTNIAYLLSRHKKKEIMPRNIYSSAVKMEFEGRLYAGPVGYDEYLRRLFGDNYMELPKESERYSVHNYRAFVKNK